MSQELEGRSILQPSICKCRHHAGQVDLPCQGIGAFPLQGAHNKEYEMAGNVEHADVIELAAEIVSAYVSNNSVPATDLPGLINEVYNALTRVGGAPVEVSSEPLKPAVSVKKSVSNDFIICLEDGKKFKSLKRHLRTQYNMSPEQYREKWGLPADYPMVAPNYAAARSRLAKEMGLGQQRRRSR
jgi:predicted transcriptional regulator